MRYITADCIFPISSPPVKKGVVIAEDDGTIINVLSFQDPSLIPHAKAIEAFRGFLCPGFINTHCHLELSHLKNKLTAGKGLPHFIKEIAMNRKATEEEIRKALVLAEDEMIAGGIVAVGDISNFNHSFEQKKKGRMKYHTFIEIFDLVPERAEEEFQRGLTLERELNTIHPSPFTLQTSITPHAPYTVSKKILNLINEFAIAHGSPISIHNQETESEDEMFIDGSGKLFETLSSFGDYYKNWKPTGSDSLSSTLVHLPRCNKMQLVHNTYTSSEDITWVHLYSMMIWWCTCPNANLFIENKLPDYRLFVDAGCRMTIGTDSYASNRSLSILGELKTITKHAPWIKLETLLRWATLNGAEFLGFAKEMGSLEKGKKPGLNLIKNVDIEKLILTEDSEVERIF